MVEQGVRKGSVGPRHERAGAMRMYLFAIEEDGKVDELRVALNDIFDHAGRGELLMFPVPLRICYVECPKPNAPHKTASNE